jgi:hypothetical protein
MIERLKSGALQIRPRIVGFCHRVEGQIGRAMEAVERIRAEVDGNLKPKDKIPMAPYHRPELDETPELDNKGGNYYQRLIGILRWACKLGRGGGYVAVIPLQHRVRDTYKRFPAFWMFEAQSHIEQGIQRLGTAARHERPYQVRLG